MSNCRNWCTQCQNFNVQKKQLELRKFIFCVTRYPIVNTAYIYITLSLTIYSNIKWKYTTTEYKTHWMSNE